MGNNPIKRTDPTGMKWANPSAAAELSAKIDSRIAKHEVSIEVLVNERDRLRDPFDRDRNKERLANIGDRLNELYQMVRLLRKAQGAIHMIGKDETYTFYFVHERGNHHIKLDGNNIYISTRDNGTSVHELVHIHQSYSSIRPLEFKNLLIY